MLDRFVNLFYEALKYIFLVLALTMVLSTCLAFMFPEIYEAYVFLSFKGYREAEFLPLDRGAINTCVFGERRVISFIAIQPVSELKVTGDVCFSLTGSSLRNIIIFDER